MCGGGGGREGVAWEGGSPQKTQGRVWGGGEQEIDMNGRLFFKH
jgi:hypothetical protein